MSETDEGATRVSAGLLGRGKIIMTWTTNWSTEFIGGMTCAVGEDAMLSDT